MKPILNKELLLGFIDEKNNELQSATATPENVGEILGKISLLRELLAFADTTI